MSKIYTYKCINISGNSNMGGNECWAEGNIIFFVDKQGWIKRGDIVEIESGIGGFTKRIWVNGTLKSKDYFNELHGSK